MIRLALLLANLAITTDAFLPQSPYTNIRSSSLEQDVQHNIITSLFRIKKDEEQEDIGISFTRSSFLQKSIKQGTGLLFLLTTTTDNAKTSIANAFDGGVGGLGKTRPETGVIFVDTANLSDNFDSYSDNTSTSKNASMMKQSPINFKGGADFNVELLTPPPADGNTSNVPQKKVFLSFYAPWPMMRSSAGIESRDLANPESAFVQVATLPPNLTEKLRNQELTVDKLPSSFFQSAVFGQTGKYGMYGVPTDIKIQKPKQSSSGTTNTGGTAIYTATFTTLTPSMIESERKVLIAASIIDQSSVFLLVVGTTAARFRNASTGDLLRKVAESFTCIEAPTTSLRR